VDRNGIRDGIGLGDAEGPCKLLTQVYLETVIPVRVMGIGCGKVLLYASEFSF